MKIFIIFFRFSPFRNRQSNKRYEEPSYLTCIFCIIGTFLFVWFIIGNYWVFSVLSKVQYTKPDLPSTYCSSICYLFSFWTIIACWIVFGLFALFVTGVVLFFVISAIVSIVSRLLMKKSNNWWFTHFAISNLHLFFIHSLIIYFTNMR